MVRNLEVVNAVKFCQDCQSARTVGRNQSRGSGPRLRTTVTNRTNKVFAIQITPYLTIKPSGAQITWRLVLYRAS